MTHTPTPWSIINDDPLEDSMFHTLSVIGGADDRVILSQIDVKNSAEKRENLAFIVRAVNSHDALVDALEKVRDFGLDDFKPGEQELYKLIDHVIAKARGEQKP